MTEPTIKVRMLYGGYENAEGPHDYFLEPVVYPMWVDDPREDEEIHESAGVCERDAATKERILRTEEELGEWADHRFAHYDLWDIEVHRGAVIEKAPKEVGPAPRMARELRDCLDRIEHSQGNRGQVLLDAAELERLHIGLSNIIEELEGPDD